jgi:hypothetical protein
MQNAAKFLSVLTVAAAVAACGSNGDQQDNRANAVEVNSSVVEVDTLPADESSATTSDELANGAADAPEGNAGY